MSNVEMTATALPAVGTDRRASRAVTMSKPAEGGRTVVVVGAGVGGLASAIRLAHAGYRVTVVEKSSMPGGRNGRWISEGFTFDTGPSLLMMTEYWEKLFSDVGRKFSDYLNVVQLIPNYRVHWPDGTRLELTPEINKYLAELETVEPGCGPRVLEYLAKASAMYQSGLKFISRNMTSVADMLQPGQLGALSSLGALGDLQKMVGKYVKDEKLKQVLSFQALYLGISPYDALAIYSLLPYTELGGGLHYPMGGMHELPRALERLGRELGIEFVYDAPVASLEKQNGRISAVVTGDGRRFVGDTVLVNADLPYAYRHLLGEDYPNIEKKKFACSVVLMYIGVNREYPDLLHHNFLVSQDMEATCRRLFDENRMPDDSPIYLVATSRTDKTQAPPGCENLFVLTLAPSQPADPAKRIDWSVEGPKVEASLLERMERTWMPGLRESIVTKKLVTPDDFTANYGNLRGEAFGLNHNLLQIGAFRPQNRHASYKNLFFVGQSTHPGCGLPMGLIGAECVTDRIRAERPARA
jgi:phytoene desaturase